jgi:hypothetical protein
MSEVTERLWRTLIHVIAVDDANSVVCIRVPAWDSIQGVWLERAGLPDVQPGDRLHARVNIGADRAGNLRFEDWER